MKVRATAVSKLAAWLLGIINFIVMATCLLWFALSLWMISSPTTMSDVLQLLGSTTLKCLLFESLMVGHFNGLSQLLDIIPFTILIYQIGLWSYRDYNIIIKLFLIEIALLPLDVMSLQNGIASAALATFFFFIAFMGLYGAVSRSQFLLFMYSTLILLLLLLECAVTYYFSSNLIEKGLQERDGQWTHALRLLFRCCDVRNMTTQETVKPPWSCCGSDYYPSNCTIDNLHENSCQSAITNWIHRNISVLYTSLAVSHLVLSSCSIVRRSRCASLSHR